MAVLLVCIANRVAHIQIVLDAPFNRVRGHALCVIAGRPVNDALAARVSAQPEHGVVHLGDGVRCGATDFVERALDRRKRKV